MNLLRFKEVRNRYGYSRGTAETLIDEGLLPAPIRISKRSVAWPEHEMNAVIEARISGADESEIKNLVAHLRVQRQKLKPAVRAFVRDSATKEEHPHE